MRKMKNRFIAAICACCLALCCFAVPVQAAGAVTLSCETVTASAGETASIDISIENNNNATCIYFAVEYDASKLTLEGCSDAGAVASGATINTDIAGIVYYVWDALNPVSGDGVLMTLNFTVKESAEDMADVSIVMDGMDAPIVADINFNVFDVAAVDGGVEIASVIYSVDVEWGAMYFTYSDGTWDPDSHSYVDVGWTCDHTNGNRIMVTNNSSVPIKTQLSFSGTDHAITATFYDDANHATTGTLLDIGATMPYYLTLSGKPSQTMDEYMSIGTIKVTIREASE